MIDANLTVDSQLMGVVSEAEAGSGVTRDQRPELGSSTSCGRNVSSRICKILLLNMYSITQASAARMSCTHRAGSDSRKGCT